MYNPQNERTFLFFAYRRDGSQNTHVRSWEFLPVSQVYPLPQIPGWRQYPRLIPHTYGLHQKRGFPPWLFPSTYESAPWDSAQAFSSHPREFLKCFP